MDEDFDLSRLLCGNFSRCSIYGCNIRITAFIGNRTLCLHRACSKLLCAIRTTCTAVCRDRLFHTLYGRITQCKRKGFTVCTESLSVFYQNLCILIQVCIRIRVRIGVQIFPGIHFDILCTESLIKMFALDARSVAAPDLQRDRQFRYITGCPFWSCRMTVSAPYCCFYRTVLISHCCIRIFYCLTDKRLIGNQQFSAGCHTLRNGNICAIVLFWNFHLELIILSVCQFKFWQNRIFIILADFQYFLSFYRLGLYRDRIGDCRCSINAADPVFLRNQDIFTVSNEFFCLKFARKCNIFKFQILWCCQSPA